MSTAHLLNALQQPGKRLTIDCRLLQNGIQCFQGKLSPMIRNCYPPTCFRMLKNIVTSPNSVYDEAKPQECIHSLLATDPRKLQAVTSITASSIAS